MSVLKSEGLKVFDLINIGEAAELPYETKRVNCKAIDNLDGNDTCVNNILDVASG